MNYLVAVIPERLKAEEAYAALQRANLGVESIEILGRGFKSADQCGLIDPAERAWRQIRWMLAWLLPFGFSAGFLFNRITGLDTFTWAGRWGNQWLGGGLGAIAAAMGGFFIGGGVGLLVGSGKALSYRRCLNQGEFLIVVRGTDPLIRQATTILRQFRPTTLQGYDHSE